jgi:hypothetical protein
MRKPGQKIAAAVTLLSLALLAFYFVFLGAMRCADRFRLCTFQSIHKGDSFQSVIKKLGKPLSFSVIAEPNRDGEYPQQHMTNFIILSHYSETNRYRDL